MCEFVDALARLLQKEYIIHVRCVLVSEYMSPKEVCFETLFEDKQIKLEV